jgi:hypothetical protein
MKNTEKTLGHIGYDAARKSYNNRIGKPDMKLWNELSECKKISWEIAAQEITKSVINIKRLNVHLVFGLLFLLSCFSSFAFSGPVSPSFTNRIITTLVVTNSTTVNGNYITFHEVSDYTRYFTNNPVSGIQTWIQTNSTTIGSASNLWKNLTTYQVPLIQATWDGTNTLYLYGYPMLAYTVEIGGNWASVTYYTNTLSVQKGLALPLSGEPIPSTATNMASMLYDAMFYATNIPTALYGEMFGNGFDKLDVYPTTGTNGLLNFYSSGGDLKYQIRQEYVFLSINQGGSNTIAYFTPSSMTLNGTFFATNSTGESYSMGGNAASSTQVVRRKDGFTASFLTLSDLVSYTNASILTNVYIAGYSTPGDSGGG